MCVCVCLSADDINCFDTGECFPLAFGVPAVLMIVSLGQYTDTAVYTRTSTIACDSFNHR